MAHRPNCAVELKIIATIIESLLIESILNHLCLAAQPALG